MAHPSGIITLTRGEISAYFRSRLPGLLQNGAEWRTQCPVHNGKRESFAINAETGQSFCHSDCNEGWDLFGLEQELTGSNFTTAKKEVFAIIGRTDAPRKAPITDRIEKLYDYTDATGRLLYQIVRLRDPKDFRQRYPDGNSGWTWKKFPGQVLYRLHELVDQPIVFITEGEKDADTLVEYGFVATTNAGGADAPWLPEYTEALRHCEQVIVLPDNDAPGRRRAARIANTLAEVVRIVSIVDLPGGKDVTDWFHAGHSEVELAALVEKDLECE